jgi:hypothetical protein
VNLPLLHRRWAGIAKVKMAAKENRAVHGSIRNRFTDYSNKSRRLARPFVRPMRRAPAASRLRQSDTSELNGATFDTRQSNRAAGCKTFS